MQNIRIATALLLLSALSGCAVIGTTAKVAGTATSTAIKTTGAVVAAPFKMAGDSDDSE